MRARRRKRERLIFIAALVLIAAVFVVLALATDVFKPAPEAATPSPTQIVWDEPAATPSPTPTSAGITAAPTPTLAPTPEPERTAAPQSTHTLELSELYRDLYEVSLTVHPEVLMPYIDGAMRLTYVNTSEDTLYEVKLRLYPNDVSPGFMSVSAVAVNDALAYYTLEGDNKSVLSVSLPLEIYPGEQAEIFLNFHIDIPEKAGRYGRTGMGIMLGNALPIAAVYEDGAWRTDSYLNDGDPFYSRCADYKVAVSAPSQWELAHTGSLYEKTSSNGWTTRYITATEVREFALALMNKPSVASADADNSRIKVYAFGLNRSRATFTAQAAAEALDYFCKNIGSYPYDLFFVVPFTDNGGMEYPGLIMVNEKTLRADSPDDGALLIGHETAHQWFYAVVGSDQLNAPWLDEALVEYLGFEFARSYLGEARTSKLEAERFSGMAQYERTHRIDDTLQALATNGTDYFYTVYASGCALFAALEEKLGGTAFYSGLRTYYNANAFGIADKQALIDAFSQVAGNDLSAWFESMLTIPEKENNP